MQQVDFTSFFEKIFLLKQTVISSEPPCQECIAQFTTVPLKYEFDINVYNLGN